MPSPALANNRTVQILEKAEKEGFGVIAAIAFDRLLLQVCPNEF